MRYHELLIEAKEIVDLRHEKSDIPFWGGEENYINPANGFYFAYRQGKLVLYSTNNAVYSDFVVNNEKSTKNLIWNILDGVVDLRAKTIQINKVSVDNKMRQHHISDIKEFQRALKELFPFGVDATFKVSGVPPHIPKTVKQILELPDPTNQVLKNEIQIMYHGTSISRLEKIKKKGLQPGSYDGPEYPDLIKNYSEHNIYLATTVNAAAFYGKRQAQKDGDSDYVVLTVKVPDPAKLLADDRKNHIAFNLVPDESDLDNSGKPRERQVPKSKDELTRQGSRQSRLKDSGRELGEFAYRGRIPASFISVFKIFKA